MHIWSSLLLVAGGGGALLYAQKMDPEAAQKSLDMVFHLSNILETGLDRNTVSILIALCDMGLDAELLAAMVSELHSEFTASPSPASAT